MEPITKLLLQEAKHVFDSTSDEEVKDFVDTEDFQDFWQHANEDIQSSESGIHFGHYKAASYDKLKTDIYSPNQLVQINRVRKFKGVHLVSDIVRCDRISVDPGMLTRSPSKSKQKFPLEKPVNDDFNLWNECLHYISSNTLKLRYTLGDFKGSSHFKEIWHVNTARTELYLVKNPASFDV